MVYYSYSTDPSFAFRNLGTFSEISKNHNIAPCHIELDPRFGRISCTVYLYELRNYKFFDLLFLRRVASFLLNNGQQYVCLTASRIMCIRANLLFDKFQIFERMYQSDMTSLKNLLYPDGAVSYLVSHFQKVLDG